MSELRFDKGSDLLVEQMPLPENRENMQALRCFLSIISDQPSKTSCGHIYHGAACIDHGCAHPVLSGVTRVAATLVNNAAHVH